MPASVVAVETTSGKCTMIRPIEHLSAVSRTMFLTLQARAHESRQLQGLFTDREAERVLQALTSTHAELPMDWITLVGIIMRTDIIDQQTRNHLASDRSATIVNLGAGLCTRYDRLDRPAVGWIEIDFADVIALRRALLPETSNHRAIACSVTDHSWLEQITSLVQAPPLFIAEGLLMYLPDSEVRSLLIALQRRFPGCRLLADTVSPLVAALYARHPILGDSGMRGHRRTLGSQRQLDRWSSGILLENMWFPTHHHPERWGRAYALWHVPFLRNVAKVVALRLHGGPRT
jgi:O-methyltransferase involved in polyketide biosynthesis